MGTTKEQRKTKGAPNKVRRSSRNPGRSTRQAARTLRNKERRICREARKSPNYTAVGWTIYRSASRIYAVPNNPN